MSLDKILRLSEQRQVAQASPGDDLRVLAQAVHLALSEAVQTGDAVRMAELVEAAATAAEGLNGMLYGDGLGDWVEATAAAPDNSVLAMASGAAAKPYGDVEYADPGYQGDGKKRYPVDTEEHVRAANSYIGKAKNAAKYSSGQLAKIKAKIHAAMSKHGIGANVEASASVVGQLLALAAESHGSVPMDHPPMKGRHGHPHTVIMVHDHEHDHMGDDSHGRSPECRNASAGKAWPNPTRMGYTALASSGGGMDAAAASSGSSQDNASRSSGASTPTNTTGSNFSHGPVSGTHTHAVATTHSHSGDNMHGGR